jgi:pilus assembly protein CpaE
MSANPSIMIMLVGQSRLLATIVRPAMLDANFEIVLVPSGEQAYQKIVTRRPDLVITDAVLPRMNGHALCALLRQNPQTSSLPLIMLAEGNARAQDESSADLCLSGPISPRELLVHIQDLLARQIAAAHHRASKPQRGHAIAVFGGKGGVGKTTIAVNLAIAIRQCTDQQVALFDADLVMGDVRVHLNLPRGHSLLDLIKHADQLDQEGVEQVLTPHESGIRVLLNPVNPIEAELIQAHHIAQILPILVQSHAYAIVDCPTSYDEQTLQLLEQADAIMLVVTPEIGAIKNTGYFLAIAKELGIALEKVYLVLNRADSDVGITAEEVAQRLHHPITFQVVSGGGAVPMSANRGVPLMITQLDHPFVQQLMVIAHQLTTRLLSRDTAAHVELVLR